MNATSVDSLRNDPNYRFAADLLDELGIEWAVIGGRVANLYRPTIRLTQDFDFMVSKLDGIREILEDAGFRIVKTPRNQDNELMQIVAHKGDQRYDFNLVDYEYQFEAIERARENDCVIVIEDVLIQKLLAWRPQDRDDLESIMKTEIAFDEALVRRWSRVFETEERLDRIQAVRRDWIEGVESSL